MRFEFGNKHLNAGNHVLTLHRNILAAGAYQVAFKAGDFHQEKMIYLTK
jgi:hypothetical protein